MKTAIYISGLGQSVSNESVDKYASRLMNEMSYATKGVEYELKSENISYQQNKTSTVVTICENKESGLTPVFKIYDFNYIDILTEKFNNRPILLKNFLLLLLVIRKTPTIFARLFNSKNYDRPYQTFYLFTIFLLISISVVLLIPGTIAAVNGYLEKEAFQVGILKVKELFFLEDVDIPFLSIANLNKMVLYLLPLINILILIVPNATTLLPNLASEFLCANDYIEHGAQQQLVQGNLEKLVDYISEADGEAKIQLHSYSFGSVLAIDFLFPFGSRVSINTRTHIEALITIGSPIAFIESYFPDFFKNRDNEMENMITWINVYSIADALATNFRSDSKADHAEFGIKGINLIPINLNYEVSKIKKENFVSFIFLHSMKAHSMYWDKKAEGQSCLRLISSEMEHQKLFG